MESERGSVAEAIPLAERALALLAEGQDGRNLARLRTALADMQLQLDPPDVDAAMLLARPGGRGAERRPAVARSTWRATTSPVLVPCCWRVTSWQRASSVPHVHARVAEQSPIAAADAKLIEGQAAAAAAGRTEDAQACLSRGSACS